MKMGIGTIGLVLAILTAGMQANAAILVRDGFDTAVAEDSNNGIYKHDTGLGFSPNTSQVGGAMVGFDAAREWTATSTYFRPYNNQLVLLPLSTTSRIASRQLAAGIMAGKTVAYGSVDFNINFPAGSGSSKIGFTTETASSSVGATIRIIWDATNLEWDLQAVYNTGSAIAVGAVMDGISLHTDYNVIWGMDSDNDTLKVWVNASSFDDAPTATFTDYGSSVSTIDDAYVQYNGMDDSASYRDGLIYDNLALGDTMGDVSSFVPAMILDVAPLSGNIMAMVINCDRPSDLYPVFSEVMSEGTVWKSIAHSSNGTDPFVATNLDYSTSSGSNVVIYATVDQGKGFFKIGMGGRTHLYAAPTAQGSGTGWDAANAAAYTETGFWNRVQDTLDSAPVQVTILDGSYADSLTLSNLGNADHGLTLSGESASGVVFNGAVSVQLSLNGSQNMVLENLNFTGSSTNIGYAFRITAASGSVPSHNITVRNCDWYDLTGVKYGSSGVAFGSHDVLFENCTFERIGLNTGSHMMYNAYDADYVSVVSCHFEDCAGSYVRFRAGSDYGVVSNCTFVSTRTYANRPSSIETFVEFPVFNDVDPGDETFAQSPVVAGNSFQFASGSPADRRGIQHYHKGFDPTGWNYLMTASEGAILEGSDASAKKTLLLNNCGIDFDEIVIEGNTWLNETSRIRFGSYAAYGATSKGWNSSADISDIVW